MEKTNYITLPAQVRLPAGTETAWIFPGIFSRANHSCLVKGWEAVLGLLCLRGDKTTV